MTISSIRSDVVVSLSGPRPTPKPAQVRFSEILASGAQSVIRGAEAAVNTIPGVPLVAAALRGASGSPIHSQTIERGSVSAPLAGPLLAAGIANATSGAAGAPSATGAGAGTPDPSANLNNALVQSQEMNLYYLRIQEEVNAQNRTFSSLSNVLKAEHDTVKTAIGNIR